MLADEEKAALPRRWPLVILIILAVVGVVVFVGWMACTTLISYMGMEEETPRLMEVVLRTPQKSTWSNSVEDVRWYSYQRIVRWKDTKGYYPIVSVTSLKKGRTRMRFFKGTKFVESQSWWEARLPESQADYHVNFVAQWRKQGEGDQTFWRRYLARIPEGDTHHKQRVGRIQPKAGRSYILPARAEQ